MGWEFWTPLIPTADQLEMAGHMLRKAGQVMLYVGGIIIILL